MSHPILRRSRHESWVLPIGAALLLLALWHGAVVLSATKVFPAPGAVLQGFAELARRGVFVSYIRDSLLRVAVGFLLATLTGIPAGLLLGWRPRLADAANPVIQILRPISPLAWIPIAIVLFGVTDASAVFLIFVASFLNITVASMNAVRGVPEIYLRAARNFGLSSSALLLRVVFPATLPELLVGLRLTLGVAWLVVVAAEMIAVDSGLGYLIVDARNAGKRYDLVVGAMILIGVIGVLLDTGIRRIERLRAVRWSFRAE